MHMDISFDGCAAYNRANQNDSLRPLINDTICLKSQKKENAMANIWMI